MCVPILKRVHALSPYRCPSARAAARSCFMPRHDQRMVLFVLSGLKRHFFICILANYVAAPNYKSLIKFLQHIFNVGIT